MSRHLNLIAVKVIYTAYIDLAVVELYDSRRMACRGFANIKTFGEHAFVQAQRAAVEAAASTGASVSVLWLDESVVFANGKFRAQCGCMEAA